MPVSRRLLHALSRDPVFLTRAVIFILAVFGVTGWIAGRSVPEKSAPPALAALFEELTQSGLTALTGAVRENPPDRMKILGILRRQARMEREAAGGAAKISAAGVFKNLKDAPLPEAERALFAAYFALASHPRAPEAASVDTVENTALPDCPSLPLMMAGDLRVLRNEEAAAFALYERARLQPGGETAAARRAVELAVRRGRTETLVEWMAKPGAREAVYTGDDAFLAMDAAAETRDFTTLLVLTARQSAEVLRRPDWLILTLLSGIVWFVSLHKACGIPARRWWIGGLGIALGILSTVVTLFFAAAQRSRGGLDGTGDSGNDFIFYVAGVGLREELAKLLLFLPLLPLLRRSTPAQALVAASCVGLGFAVEENIQYYLRSGGLAAIPRFFSANFMHIALTGLTGLAAFQALRYPRTALQGFLAVFLLMVLLHGIYNYMLSTPILLRGLETDSGLASTIILLGLAWFYFQTLEQQRDAHPQTIAPHAVLTLGAAVIIGATFCAISSQLGAAPAFMGLTPIVLADVILAALFIQKLR